MEYIHEWVWHGDVEWTVTRWVEQRTLGERYVRSREVAFGDTDVVR